MTGQPPVLEVTNLTVDFRLRRGTPLRAVDGVSLALRAGETLALVGESGSGKSTVVRALAQFVRPSSGEILLRGAPVRQHGRGLRAYRSQVQMVFQDPFASLNPMHTVDHHLRRPLLLQPGHPRGDALDEAVYQLLRSVNLTPPEDIARKRPHELSGGQRQRVAIARALATKPAVLLADEPVSMLDVSIRLEILNLIDSLKREHNLAVLYVTHDLATARHFSSEILVMYRGEIVERGPSDTVILESAHPYTQLLGAAAPRPTASRAELDQARRTRQAASSTRTAEQRTVGQQDGNLGAGCRFRPRCPSAMDACAARPGDLTVRPGHVVRCWLHDPTTSRTRATA